MLSCTGAPSQKDSGESFGGGIIEKVSFIDVKINDKFWKPKITDQHVPPEHDPNADLPRRWRHPSYFQDHLPFEEQFKASGHTVMAVYLYFGVNVISFETRSKKYLPALDSLWNDIVKRNFCVTGGMG